MNKKNLTSLEVLKRARAAVKSGWTQGSLADNWTSGETRVCTLGALNLAITGDAEQDVLYAGDVDEFGEYGGTIDVDVETHPATKLLNRLAKKRGYEYIVAFNDDETTKKKDVVRLFDEAIQRVERKRKSDAAYRKRVGR